MELEISKKFIFRPKLFMVMVQRFYGGRPKEVLLLQMSKNHDKEMPLKLLSL
jgi:hypothetical protein